MVIGYIPRGVLASILIFWPCSVFDFGSQKSACLWGFLPPWNLCPLLKALPHQHHLMPFPSLIPKLPPHWSFSGFQRNKTSSYHRAFAHTVPSACSSPSRLIFPEKAFSSLYLNKPHSLVFCDTWYNFTLFYLFWWLYFFTARLPLKFHPGSDLDSMAHSQLHPPHYLTINIR